MPKPTNAEIPDAAVVALAERRFYSETDQPACWADVGGERKARRLDDARRDLEAARPAIEQAVEERLRNALGSLLDQQREALDAFRQGIAGSGNWLARIESEIDTALQPKEEASPQPPGQERDRG